MGGGAATISAEAATAAEVGVEDLKVVEELTPGPRGVEELEQVYRALSRPGTCTGVVGGVLTRPPSQEEMLRVREERTWERVLVV